MSDLASAYAASQEELAVLRSRVAELEEDLRKETAQELPAQKEE